MTSKEMLKTQCKSGYWFVNIAPLGELPQWEMQKAPYSPSMDQKTIFGYEQKAFMARQYR